MIFVCNLLQVFVILCLTCSITPLLWTSRGLWAYRASPSWPFYHAAYLLIYSLLLTVKTYPITPGTKWHFLILSWATVSRSVCVCFAKIFLSNSWNNGQLLTLPVFKPAPSPGQFLLHLDLWLLYFIPATKQTLFPVLSPEMHYWHVRLQFHQWLCACNFYKHLLIIIWCLKWWIDSRLRL